ncbi:MAG: hypothetical protein L3J23_01140 [Flavobacteriaceae bacterium]|nr:hypothetical protein [Flavobacteriaceae bacterium]
MITFEIILFIVAILLGILLYWRESKNNYLFRLINRITHSKEQQLKKENKKGFFFRQPFLIRFVYLVILILMGYLISLLIIPFNFVTIQYLITMIIGTVLGTYFASLIIFATDKVEDGQDIIEEALKKSKKLLKELTDEDESKKIIQEMEKPKEEETTKKSARDRLKDKGFIQ